MFFERINEWIAKPTFVSKYQDSKKECMLLMWAWSLLPLTHKAWFLNPCLFLVREGCFLIQVSSLSAPNVKENDISIPWKTQEKLPFLRDSLCGRGGYDSRFWLWFWCHGWLSPSLVKGEDSQLLGSIPALRFWRHTLKKMSSCSSGYSLWPWSRSK